MGTIKSFFERHSIFWLGIILVVSTYAKFAYAFYFTEYNNYLFGEMGEFWHMAAESFYRGDIDTGQWMLWPPIAHIALAWVFKILYFFDLYQYKLEIVLGINVILSALSVVMIYMIALRLFGSRVYALVVSFIYAFFFQLIYFNAFVVILNPAIFLYLLAITTLLYSKKDNLRLFFSGAILALSVSFKPVWILSIFPFLGYTLFTDESIKSNISRTISLLSGFGMLIFFVIVNNNAISTGKLKTLSTNEGLNYYISSCNKSSLASITTEDNRTYAPIHTQNTPELGTVNVSKPFYEQMFFYKNGRECLHRTSNSFKDKLNKLKLLYSDSMYPVVNDAIYAKKWLPAFDRIAFWLTLLLLFVPFMYADNKLSKPTLSLLITLILSQLLILNSLGAEQRDLYGFFFGVVLLGVLTPFTFAHTIKRLWWIWIGYLIIALGGGLEYASKPPLQSKYISINLLQNNSSIYDLEQDRNITKTVNKNINTVNFKGQYSLEHSDMGLFEFDNNFFIDMRVGVDVAKDGNYSFVVVSNDGYRLRIDDRIVIANSDTSEINLNTNYLHLSKGKHRFDLSYFHSNGTTALRVYYDINNTRYLIGQDSQYIRFFYIGEDEHFVQKKRQKKRRRIKKKVLKKSKKSAKKVKSKKRHHSK